MRPRNRTLTMVHENILDDLIAPGYVVAKRIRCRVDGSKYLKVFVDEADRSLLEERIDSIITIYRKLTNNEISIEFRKEEPFYSVKK